MGRLLAYWSFDEGIGNTALDVVSNVEDTIHYVFRDAQYKPPSNPVWKAGIKGQALLFDGYSTWIQRDKGLIKEPLHTLTIQAWIAPRSFGRDEGGRLSAVVSERNLINCEGYILGTGKHGTISFQAGTGDAWYDLNSHNFVLPISQWSFITAVFDGPGAKMSLYINGLPVAEMQIPEGSKIKPSNQPLLIGKDNEALPVNEAFHINMFNGLIDEIKLENAVLSEKTIASRFKGYLEEKPGHSLHVSLKQDRSLYSKDRHRPQYHFIAPEHWMNEPHAPLYYKGKYHIFYQHNPLGPFFNHIHWGHAVSEDMVHWKDLPFALTPEKGGIDPDGDWSGCSVINDQELPLLVYTAGDDSKKPNQMIALARSTFLQDGDLELKKWNKDQAPIVTQREGIGWFGQFRDPFVWKDEDTWYMLVGSGIKGKGGTALAYTSRDFINWEYKNPFFVGNYNKYPATGHVWELPVFLKLGRDSSGNEKHILLVNPWFDGHSQYYCKYVWYWVGSWKKDEVVFIPDQEEPQLLDLGEHFTGPSGFIDPLGRCVIFSIAQDRRTEKQHYDSGWAHNAGLPVILYLREDDRLGIKPIPELQTLRTKKLVSIQDTLLGDTVKKMGDIQGEMLEILLSVDISDKKPFGIKVRTTSDESEMTLICFNPETSELSVDRTNSSKEPDVEKNVVSGHVALKEALLRLHIYIDHSMLEIYANNLKGFTTRTYPTSADARHIRLHGDSSTVIKNLEIWQLKSAYED